MYLTFIVLFCFIALPMVMTQLAGSLTPPKKSVLITVIVFFLAYDILFLNGITFVGDNVDYTFFGLQCTLVAILLTIYHKPQNWYLKLLRYLVIFIYSLGLVFYLFAHFIPDPGFRQYSACEIFDKEFNGNKYQIRTYLYDKGRYTIYQQDVYRKLKYLPFEVKVNEHKSIGVMLQHNFAGIKNILITAVSDNEILVNYEYDSDVEWEEFIEMKTMEYDSEEFSSDTIYFDDKINEFRSDELLQIIETQNR